MDRACSQNEEGRSAFKILTGKPAGNKSLGMPRRRWEDNIRMDLNKLNINTKNWVDLAQERGYWRALVNAALKFWVLKVMEFVSCNGKIL